jgi:beta-glucanase (GH16 family)
MVVLAAFLGKMAYYHIATPPKNEHQWSVNDFWSYIIDNSRAVQRHPPIIIILATFLGQNASNDIATTSKNERQWSVNDFWACILDYQTAMQQR